MRGAANAGLFVPREMIRGARQGARFGAGVNTRMADVMSGNALYRHSSRADDAAVQQERARSERLSDSEKTREAYSRMSDVLERLDEKL